MRWDEDAVMRRYTAHVARGLEAGGQALAAAVDARAPRRTGRSRPVQVTGATVTGDTVSLHVGFGRAGFYQAYQDRGTSRHRAQPWADEALAAAGPAVVRAVTRGG